MGWFDDYDRNYRYDRGFGRGDYPAAYGNMAAANGLGYWGTPYGYWGGMPERGYRGRSGYDRGFGYDRVYRRPPSESPAYGRQGDREVQRWATRHGYDAGYAIEPHPGRGGMDMDRGGRGGYGGYGDADRGMNRGRWGRSRNQGRNDWGYGW